MIKNIILLSFNISLCSLYLYIGIERKLSHQQSIWYFDISYCARKLCTQRSNIPLLFLFLYIRQSQSFLYFSCCRCNISCIKSRALRQYIFCDELTTRYDMANFMYFYIQKSKYMNNLVMTWFVLLIHYRRITLFTKRYIYQCDDLHFMYN